jgi:Ni/Fe-hydrogenase subunit HybB-like protein
MKEKGIMNKLIRNLSAILKEIGKGGHYYYLWIGFLLLVIFLAAGAYALQIKEGLIVTAMRDQVSWGLYISNFAFLVGVAAAAVLLVIPAYIYNFKPIREIVLFGEILAVTVIIMCTMFIIVDLGRPERVWHILPIIGAMSFPQSLLAWDVIALNGYLAINLFVVFYVLYKISHSKEYSMNVVRPLVILSIPWAVSIHTVTAFLFNGLAARPFWNASILAPRFLASAFCAGPAIMLIVFQIIRRFSKVEIGDRALNKIGELIAYAMGINIFLLGAEMFKEFYSGTLHTAPMRYMYFGLHGHNDIVVWMWISLIFNIIAFLLFLSPRARDNFFSLNLACILSITGIYIEKGLGLILPGFVPGTLGEIYEYSPTNTEILITMGVWAAGALIYTLMLKVAIPIYTGELKFVS